MENTKVDTWNIFSSKLNGHAIASPSSYTRWSVCPGSVYYTLTQHKTENIEATQGTLAHDAAAYILGDYTFFRDKERVIENISQLEKGHKFYKTVNKSEVKEFFVDQQTVENVKAYVLNIVAFIEALVDIDDWEFGVETKTKVTEHYNCYSNVLADHYHISSYGTIDFVAWNNKTKEVYVVDFKNGNLYVPQEDNSQLLFYAINNPGHFDVVSICGTKEVNSWQLYYAIYQPSINDVLQFSKVKDNQARAFDRAYRGKISVVIDALVTKVLKNKLNDQEWVLRYLNPNEKACQFCVMKKRNCPAFANAVNAVTVPKDITSLSDEEVYDHYKKLQFLADYKESVDKEVASRVERGSSIPLKFVKGPSRKKYLEEDRLKEELKIWEDVYPGLSQKIYQENIVGLTILKDILKKDGLTKKQIEEIVSSVTVVTEGKPKLVPSSDKRPEYISVESLPNLDSDD